MRLVLIPLACHAQQENRLSGVLLLEKTKNAHETCNKTASNGRASSSCIGHIACLFKHVDDVGASKRMDI